MPWDAAHDKIATAIAADEVPDVSMIGTTWMGEFATTGGLDPTPPDLIDESTFFEGAWGSTEVGGTSYARAVVRRDARAVRRHRARRAGRRLRRRPRRGTT